MASPNIHPIKGGARGGAGGGQPSSGSNAESVPKSVGAQPANHSSVGQSLGSSNAKVSDSVQPANHSSVVQPSSGSNAESEPHIGGISIGGGGGHGQAKMPGSAKNHSNKSWRNNRDN